MTKGLFVKIRQKTEKIDQNEQAVRLGFLGRNFGGFFSFYSLSPWKNYLFIWLECMASHGVILKPSKALTLNLQLRSDNSLYAVQQHGSHAMTLLAHFNGFPVFSQGSPISLRYIFFYKKCIQLHTFALYLLYCWKFSEIVTGIYQLARTLFSMIINRL